ncbi:galactose mutarotase-like protein [Coprinopsis sp. MPI-PUGE-AT-0042]|nr:galactose mutarotase-like protein [Coprinopsis sp. MPI-PUGE-AT-0042]
MRYTSFVVASALFGSVLAQAAPGFHWIGATLTQLWVKDKESKATDVVLGYDDTSRWWSDPDHPVFNAIVGRYANRIKNGTFSIPITKLPQPPGPNVYQIPTNDRGGEVTLHGGLIGWDRRNWTLVAKSRTSVTYKHVDEADEGFPGTVTALATHTVSNGGVLRTSIQARATQKTPIMLTQHLYWNLDGFKNGVNDTLGHTLRVGSSKIIELDGNAIPTGKFINVAGTVFDLRKPTLHGQHLDEAQGLCGAPCSLYDHCWVYDKGPKVGPATTLQSEKSGIQLDITTNQDAVQVYSAYWLNTPRKAAHGGADLKYGSYGGIAIEQQGLVDAINTPEWSIDQIHDPKRPYEWSTTYKFSTKR